MLNILIANACTAFILQETDTNIKSLYKIELQLKGAGTRQRSR